MSAIKLPTAKEIDAVGLEMYGLLVFLPMIIVGLKIFQKIYTIANIFSTDIGTGNFNRRNCRAQ